MVSYIQAIYKIHTQKCVPLFRLFNDVKIITCPPKLSFLFVVVFQLLNHIRLFATWWTWKHARLSCSSLSLRVSSNSCTLCQQCHPNISSSVTPLSFCPQSFPASGSFPMSLLFASCGQSIGTSASASVLPVNIQGWFPLGLTGLASLQSKRISRVFSSLKIPNCWFFFSD